MIFVRISKICFGETLRRTSIRFVSSHVVKKLHEVGLLTAVKEEGNYQTGQLFLHRIFGYRAVILFPCSARIFDQQEGRNNIQEIQPQSVTYYQALTDKRDTPHLRAHNESVTFISKKKPDQTLYTIPGVVYVAHEDVIPYISTERTPIEHQFFDEFFSHDSDKTPNFVPKETLRSWQYDHNQSLERFDVFRDVTDQIRVTVIPFYIGSRSLTSEVEHWWRYSIRIENLNPNEAVTLRQRFWRIFNSSGHLEVFSGKGVAEQEPRLSKEYPAFEYSSHVSLTVPNVQMWGTFQMEKDDGTLIDVRIPRFDLRYK